MSNTYVSELIATRLSHDIAGIAGAIANAAELLEDGDADDLDDVRQILGLSSGSLTKRLKFFRQCFGLSNNALKSTDDLKTITEQYLQTLGNPKTPIVLELQVMTQKVYKLVMPAVMLMADALIKGGKITVGQTSSSLLVSAVSEAPLDTKKLENISKILKGEIIEENPSAYAPLYYLLDYLGDSGVKIALDGNTLVIGA